MTDEERITELLEDAEYHGGRAFKARVAAEIQRLTKPPICEFCRTIGWPQAKVHADGLPVYPQGR